MTDKKEFELPNDVLTEPNDDLPADAVADPDATSPGLGVPPKGPPVPLCLYHADCVDGFTSAWVVYHHLKGAVELRAAKYGDPLPEDDVMDREVYVVDFSYPRAVTEKLIRLATKTVILDHHKTAQKALADLGWGDNHECVFDMHRSGAGLAWDHLMPGRPRPNLVRYVEDRDLWRFALPWSREVSAFIGSYDQTIQQWDVIAAGLEQPKVLADCVLEGAGIDRQHRRTVAQLANEYRRRMTINGMSVWAVNAPHTYASDLGHLLAAGEPFAAVYWETAAGRVFSLRSQPGGADVAAIAERFGGGGHARAAGFTVALTANPEHLHPVAPGHSH